TSAPGDAWAGQPCPQPEPCPRSLWSFLERDSILELGSHHTIGTGSNGHTACRGLPDRATNCANTIRNRMGNANADATRVGQPARHTGSVNACPVHTDSGCNSNS